MALVAGVLWSGGRAAEGVDPHYAFALFWLLSAGLALAWNSRVAAHLAAIAGLAWWVIAALTPPAHDTPFTVANGAALMLGAGLLMDNARPAPLQSFGATLSNYGAFALAVLAAFAAVASGERHFAAVDPPAGWAVGCGLAGLISAFAAAFSAAADRRAGSIFAGIAIALVMAVANRWVQPFAGESGGEPWLAYALELVAMLCLVVSGMLDGARPRMVAGWIGLAGVIASITWAVKGSLLRRSVFLAVAGAAAMAIATLLGRWLPGEDRP